MIENNQKHNSNTIHEVIQREQAWTQAHLDLDLKMIDEIASEHYRQRQADGTYTGKADLLASYRSGQRYWEVARSSDHHVQIDNDLAVVIGHWYGKGISNGDDFDYYSRFLSIYMLEYGSWKMVLDVSIPEE